MLASRIPFLLQWMGQKLFLSLKSLSVPRKWPRDNNVLRIFLPYSINLSCPHTARLWSQLSNGQRAFRMDKELICTPLIRLKAKGKQVWVRGRFGEASVGQVGNSDTPGCSLLSPSEGLDFNSSSVLIPDSQFRWNQQRHGKIKQMELCDIIKRKQRGTVGSPRVGGGGGDGLYIAFLPQEVKGDMAAHRCGRKAACFPTWSPSSSPQW